MIYRFAEFELDTRLLELRHGGVAAALEPQVFDLLAYLVEHRDRVVSKEELLDKLWPGRFVSETTLTSRLKDARKAVGDSGTAQIFIRTHHGRGYRFVADVHPTAATAATAAENIVLPSLDPGELFVGRAVELEELRSLLSEAQTSSSRRIAFVAAEAGAGKTTLVEHFLRQLRGVRLLRGQCLEFRGAGEAYMPIFDAFERFSRGADGESLVDLLRREAPACLAQMPSLSGSSEPAGDRAASARMLRGIGGAIEKFAASVPLILLIEDLHWSDHSTVDLIDYLARHSDAAKLLVIGTYRPADVRASGHPIHRVANELAARKLATLMALPALLGDDLQEIIRLRFGEVDFAGSLAAVLEQRTSGNPLFVRDLIEAWMRDGRIVSGNGRWSLLATPEELQTSMPQTLHAMIEQQIERLSAEQQRALEAASVAGREFTAAAAAAAIGVGEDAIEVACEPLVREGRFLRSGGTESWPDGTFAQRYAFIHDLYVDVLYHRLPEARRARLHAALGRRLEEAWNLRPVDRAAELAHHFARGNDHQRAARYRKLAAKQALGRNAHHEAVEHFLAALADMSGSSDPESGREELAIRTQLAASLVATRGYADSLLLENYRRAEELSRMIGDLPALSRTLYGMAVMREYRGEFEETERLMKEKLTLDAGARSELESHQLLSCSYIHQGRYQECVDHADHAIESLDRTPQEDGDLILLLESHGWAAGALYFLGYPDTALQRCEMALDRSRSVRNEIARASSLVQMAFVRFYRREPGHVTQIASEAIALGREFRFPFHVGVGQILSGWHRATEHADSAAIDDIRAGLRICRSIGATLDDPIFLAILAEALIRLGRLDDAASELSSAMTIVRSTRSFFYEPEIVRLHGVVHLAQGRERDAKERFSAAIEAAKRQRSPMLALRAAVSLAGADPVAGRPIVAELLAAIREGESLEEIRDARAVLRGAPSNDR